MIAYCGIHCDACSIRLAANDPEQAACLAQAWQDEGLKDAKPEWFRCQGCEGPDALVWSEDCAIRACCRARGLDNCSQCNTFPCEKILAFEAEGGHHAKAVAALRSLI